MWWTILVGIHQASKQALLEVKSKRVLEHRLPDPARHNEYGPMMNAVGPRVLRSVLS